MENLVKNAVEKFVTRDSYLLDLSAHEQAISHRIAVYVEELVHASESLMVKSKSKEKSISIDCEYNKHLRDPKRMDLKDLEVVHEDMLVCKCESCQTITDKGLDNVPDKHFRPDIVVHSRGDDDLNLIIVEVKKGKVCPFDEAKLRELTKVKNNGGEYEYELGVFIWFENKKPQYKWFLKGEQV